jgi:hypothetical protein
MNRPLPHQLIQVPPGWNMPPPLMPLQDPPAPARPRRRVRVPRALREDAFWTGALTALCIGGLLAVILATS